MRIAWSLPVRGETLDSSRGDVVRARSLVLALRALGHEVVVVEDAGRAAARTTVGAYRGLLRPLLPRRLALVLRDAGRVLHARRHARAVAAAARAHRAQLLVETQVGFAGSAALAQRLTRLPLVLDDCSPSSEEDALGAGLPGLARRVLAANARAAARVIAVSRAVEDALVAEGVPRERIRLVPNGVDLAAFARADRDAARARLGLGDALVLGFVGSFQPWHRTELLVEAAARLARALPSLRVLLVGDGPGREGALARADELGIAARVLRTGAVPASEVPSLVAAFDVGVLPGSNDYGHPMKLVEHGAAGVPSVAPDLPPVREVLRDGETGLLFPPGDADALAAALGRLLAEPALRRRLGDAARADAERCAWTARAAALLEGLSASGA